MRPTPDIIPYDRETAAAMAALLHEMGIGSMGPAVAAKLIEMAAEIERRVKADVRLQDDGGWPLLSYAHRLRDIGMVQGEMAGLVVIDLGRLLKQEKERP